MTTAPTARTIYSYSTPSSPYPAYQRSTSQRVYGNAAPCSCPDCHSSGISAPRYASEPYASTSYAAEAPLQFPPDAYQPYLQTDQPLYRPIPVRPEPAYSYAAGPPPSLPSPPLEDQLPIPEPLSYPSNWAPDPIPSPPPFPPPPVSRYTERAPPFERPAYAYQPQTPNTPSTGLLAPFSLKGNLDRRRSSGGSSIYEPSTMTLSRRSSAMSLGSPFGSECSFGSYGSDEGEEPRQDIVTPFMSKLHLLLSNPEYNEVIRWNADGTAFMFAQSTQELSDAFSKVFRHGNSHSFVRQLNIYDFKRLTSLELHAAVESNPHPGSPLTSADFAGFAHPLFFRDQPNNICDLSKIKPKMGKKPSTRNLAAMAKQRASPYEPVTIRTRALRSDGKVGGGMKGRKL
ncbi:hypothetical protein JCM6882_002867 [Rhodosporidiobolus microsporus]